MLRAMAVDPSRSDLAAAGDEALVLRARNGDREAFGELVNRHQRRLWMVCRQYLGAAEADAAAQDTLVKAFVGLVAFDGRAAFPTWLTRIAINTCLDELRRRRRRAEVTEDAAAEGEGSPLLQVADGRAGPEEASIQRQTVARLARSEAGLPPRQREIFRLRFYAGLELEEIAAALGVHVGTVKTQLHRAVHRLRQELEVGP
jgi:RNA polymerase sigma-70 factor (ECF subfamily)